MRPPNLHRPELPQSLLSQLGADIPSRKPNASWRNGRPDARRIASSRKALRKQTRVEKKVSRKRTFAARGDFVANDEGNEEANLDGNDISDGGDVSDASGFASEEEIKMPLVKKQKVETRDGTPHVSRAVRAALEEEDARIKRLEKKLGVKQKKSVQSIAALEGLDHIFGQDEAISDSEVQEKEEYENYLLSKREHEGEEETDANEEEIGVSDEDMDDEDEWSSDNEDALGSSNKNTNPKERENPYKPPIPAAAKYIPPSLRRSTASDTDEALQNLKRQLQGRLNKLTESNMPSILRELDETLSNNARQHVFTLLTDLIINLTADRSAHNDSFLILHAGFISGLYRTMGTQFAAQMVEALTRTFFSFYEQSNLGKEANNLVGLLAFLYSFQVIGSTLMFDYLRLLLDSLSETNTELLLKVVRNTGPQLRKDDPAALKDVVILLQKAVVEQGGEQTLSVRTKFMIETIIDLKNNRQKAGPAMEQTSRQIVSLRKILGGVGRSAEPLGIGLADLQQADKTGKWWLVGASWKPVEETRVPSSSRREEKATKLGDEEIIDHWAEAVSHGLNTDVKRRIYVAIQSAFDAKHALIQLRKQNLNVKQRLEIPGVLLDILALAESYNPFYRLIAQDMCAEHKYRKAFQFKLWEAFRQLGEPDLLSGKDSRYTDTKLDFKQAAYLGKFYGELLALRKLPITIVRTVDFLQLQKRTKTFLEVLLVTLFESVKPQAGEDREQAIEDIFSQAKEEPREMIGLRFRIQKVPNSALLNKQLMKSKTKKRVLALAEKAIEVLDRLASRVGA